MWGWEIFFGELLDFLQSCARQLGVSNSQFADYALERLERSVQALAYIQDVLTNGNGMHSSTSDEIYQRYSEQISSLSECLTGVYTEWEQYRATLEISPSTAFSVSTMPSNRQRGRPRFQIHREQIVYLRSMSFTWHQIAELLGVSRMTIHRRYREFGLHEELGRNRMINTDLDTLLREMRVEFPTMGETMVWGRLQSLGCSVTREQLRQSIRRTDPLHTALRSPSAAISRRPYSVPGPNSLWHIGKLLNNLVHDHSFLSMLHLMVYTQLCVYN